MIFVLQINKKPEPDYPMEFYKSTVSMINCVFRNKLNRSLQVISEDGADHDHDDCTILVLEYK